MIKYILCLLLIPLTSFSQDVTFTNKLVGETLKLFYANVAVKKYIPIVVENLGVESFHGYCMMTQVNQERVILNQSFYAKYKNNKQAIEYLIIHELGHCLLGYEHDPELVIVNGLLLPKSIMYPENIGMEDWYIRNRLYYLKEYFCRTSKEYPICKQK